MTKIDRDFPSKTKDYYWGKQKDKKRAYNHRKHRESVKEQARMQQAAVSPPVFKLEASGATDAVLGAGERLKIVSVWKVPDLTFNGFRQPELSRQFVIELNQAIRKDMFERKVRKAFGL